ncbi:MAG: hypothetical protein M1817_003608 [Caeruleum heppii]|nr:MAG: hypothetical protein M1817_003608 [Caeruleum heppii]
MAFYVTQVQRALAALSIVQPSRLPDAIAALYNALWVESIPVQEPEQYTTILRSVIGEETTRVVLERSTSDQGKKHLADLTDEALESGCFGLPWFVATNTDGETEGFWGFDHLGQVIDHLKLERPTEGIGSEGGWRAML